MSVKRRRRSNNERLSDDEIIDPSHEHESQISSADFNDAFGETLSATLNLDTWTKGIDLAEMFAKLTKEVEEALTKEDEIKHHVRQIIFEKLRDRPHAPKGAGVYNVLPSHLKRTQNGILFNGQVEACDGNCLVHDTLPLTIAQVGVNLVSYHGEQGSWINRLYRRDLRIKGQDPVDEVLSILGSRQLRAAINEPGKKDTISNLLTRGIMAYAERAILTYRSDVSWRMGHGNPSPYELLTGSGSMELLGKGLILMKDLILGHRKFIYIPSAPSERGLITIGNALRALEYAVVEDNSVRMKKIVEEGHLRGDHRRKAVEFYREVGPQIVTGVYRAGADVPPQLFYSHIDHVHEAALIAMADSIIQVHRGFPTLIDLADNICRTQFGSAAFKPYILAAYASHGHGLSYLNERETRD